MTIDIFGDFVSPKHPFLPVIRELDKVKDIRINLMGAVHPSLLHIQKRKYEHADVAIGFGWPKDFSGMLEGDYKHKVGIITWETNKVPYGSYFGEKKVLQALDLLLVQSKWHRDLFEHVGVPIEIVPMPYANYLQPVDRDYTKKPFTFICEGTLTLRANVGMIISAFLDLFQDRDDVQLILKTDSGTLGHLSFPYKNLHIVDKLSTPTEHRELLEKAHCFVYPSRAEDFPTSLVNAMATDLPVIIPKHSVFAGYGGLTIETSELVPAERYSSKFGSVGQYWQPDYNELKNLMQYAESHLMNIKLFGQANGRNVRMTHGVNRVTSDIISMIRNLEHES